MPGVIKYITVKDIPKGGANNFMPTSFGFAEEEVMSRLFICLLSVRCGQFIYSGHPIQE